MLVLPFLSNLIREIILLTRLILRFKYLFIILIIYCLLSFIYSVYLFRFITPVAGHLVVPETFQDFVDDYNSIRWFTEKRGSQGFLSYPEVPNEKPAGVEYSRNSAKFG